MTNNKTADELATKKLVEGNLVVIFDFDGTLANTIDLAARIYNENAHNFGALPVDMTKMNDYRKAGYKKSMKIHKIRWSILPKLVLFVSKEMKKHMDEVKPYPKIVEVLRDLQNNNVSIGVLTSNNTALVQDFFEANNFPIFDFVVSEKTMFGKEKALRKIIKRHQLSKDNVIYVGDEPRDITACRKAGIKVIGVTWGFGGREGLQSSPPDVFVDTADQLKKTILGFN